MALSTILKSSFAAFVQAEAQILCVLGKAVNQSETVCQPHPLSEKEVMTIDIHTLTAYKLNCCRAFSVGTAFEDCMEKCSDEIADSAVSGFERISLASSSFLATIQSFDS